MTTVTHGVLSSNFQPHVLDILLLCTLSPHPIRHVLFRAVHLLSVRFSTYHYEMHAPPTAVLNARMGSSLPSARSTTSFPRPRTSLPRSARPTSRLSPSASVISSRTVSRQENERVSVGRGAPSICVRQAGGITSSNCLLPVLFFFCFVS